MDIDYKKVDNKEQLLSIIRELSDKDSSDWENTTTKEFLEALGSWLEDANGFYKNFDLDTNSNKPSWQLFADALQAATKYE